VRRYSVREVATAKNNRKLIECVGPWNEKRKKRAKALFAAKKIVFDS